MDELIARLYGLAGWDIVEDDALVEALGLSRCGDKAVCPDGVADLASTLEAAVGPSR